MLETIREYAAERLAERNETETLRRRHAAYFLALAQEAEPNLRSRRNPTAWLERLEAEDDNLRAALDCYETAAEGQDLLRLAGALARYWYLRAHVDEGRGRLGAALAASTSPTPERGAALNGAAVLALTSGDVAAGRAHAEEGLAIHRLTGDEWRAAEAEFLLGHVAADEADWELAGSLFEPSVRQFRDLGDEHFALTATYNLAVVVEKLGDLERARSLHEEVIERARAHSDDRVVALSLDQLAALYARDPSGAELSLAMLKEALVALRDQRDQVAIVDNFGRFAFALALLGRPEVATRLLSSAEALRRKIGEASVPWVAAMNEETREAIRAQLDDDAFAAAWAEGQPLSIEEAVELALAT